MGAGRIGFEMEQLCEALRPGHCSSWVDENSSFVYESQKFKARCVGCKGGVTTKSVYSSWGKVSKTVGRDLDFALGV